MITHDKLIDLAAGRIERIACDIPPDKVQMSLAMLGLDTTRFNHDVNDIDSYEKEYYHFFAYEGVKYKLKGNMYFGTVLVTIDRD